jgi:hypothetical protein
MTTSITIDAHAGWPVKVVEVFSGAQGQEISRTEHVVAPYNRQIFNLYTGRHIAEVSELSDQWQARTPDDSNETQSEAPASE